MFVNCLVKQFAICLDVLAILLLNVMELLSVVGDALLDNNNNNNNCLKSNIQCIEIRVQWIDHVWSSKECVCCACGPSERLDAPSITHSSDLDRRCTVPIFQFIYYIKSSFIN